MSANKTYNTPFWLLIIGVALILVGRNFFAEGMFLDGVVYACISRNMACGLGDFWNPHYTQTIGSVFHSHPPLALGLEALMFKLFGDHLFVERLYSLMMYIASGWLIALIWKRTTDDIRRAWIPLLFWIAMPIVAWSAENNMLENTMAVFVLLSVYLMIVSYQQNSRIWLLLAGISLFASFLSKGVTGLFPLVFPLVYCCFDDQRRWTQGLVDGLLLLVVMAALMGLMFLVFPSSLAYMKDYVSIQLIGGGLNEVTVSNRFMIVWYLLQEMIGPVLILVLMLLIRKAVLKSKVKMFEYKPDRRWFFVFLVLGLTGVLPIMISMKQSSFYMIAALPFFAIALGHLALGLVNPIGESLKQGRLWRSMVAGLACTVLLCGLLLPWLGMGRYSRDEALIKNVKEVLATTGDERVVGINPSDYNQWTWHAYFMRYGKVSLDTQNNNKIQLCY